MPHMTASGFILQRLSSWHSLYSVFSVRCFQRRLNCGDWQQRLASLPFSCVLDCGHVVWLRLQGAGKTTAAGKLALYLKEREVDADALLAMSEEERTGTLASRLPKRQRRVLLAAADVYRPAAIEQLEVLGKSIGVEVFSLGTDADPAEIARQAVDKAQREGFDTVVVDTAGRQVVDEELMQELRRVKQTGELSMSVHILSLRSQLHGVELRGHGQFSLIDPDLTSSKTVEPDETLLVVDAMTGQAAASLTASFDSAVGITGAILTKLDGDSRGEHIFHVCLAYLMVCTKFPWLKLCSPNSQHTTQCFLFGNVKPNCMLNYLKVVRPSPSVVSQASPSSSWA